MLQPIHHTFGPHIRWRYWLRAELLCFQPWKWQRGRATERLKAGLKEHLGGDVALFGSGREGLLALLRSLNLGSGAEVIIQGFTCVVLPNAIHAAGYTPVYADLDPDSLNLTAESVRARLTERTKVVICQHTFGIPAELTELRALCDERNLILIEDCAHVIPDAKGPALLGKEGDYIMLSFGRDKAISGISGGAIIARKGLPENLRKEEEQTIDVPRGTIFRLLLYADTYMAAKLFYSILWIGRGCLLICKWLRLLLPVVTQEEKKGNMSLELHRMPNACAELALQELKNLQAINDHRRTITAYYWEQAGRLGWKYPKKISPTLPLQKFPVLVQNAEQVRVVLKKKNIHLEDGWTSAVVCPRSSDQLKANYTKGSCPFAEGVAWTILSLPTHPTMSLQKAKYLIAVLQVTLPKHGHP